MAEQAAVQTMPPVDAAAIAEAHRQLLDDRSIQFDVAPMVPPKIPDWLKWLAELLSSPFGKYIFWGVVAIGALLILYLLLHKLDLLRWLRARRSVEASPEDLWRPEEGPARALLHEADALADQGRYDEAAHLLLYRSIEEIDSRRPRLIRPALTSRDIAAAPELPQGPRSAFENIAMMVERSLFAGQRLDEPDWRTCRAAFEEFAFAEAWA